MLVASDGRGLCFSQDGVVWRDVAEPDSQVRSVASLGDGFVAVGYGCDDAECTTAVWASPDGITWSRETPEPGFFEGGFTTVRAVGPGLVAFSMIDAARTGHWTWGG